MNKVARALGPEAVLYMADPVGFTEYVLRESMWERMARVCYDLLSEPKAKVAVKACHGSSKTWTAAVLTLWWVLQFPQGKVVTTAPVFTQVENILWAEIRSLWENSELAQTLLPMPLTTDLKVGPQNYATGISTDEAVRFQGWHGKVLFIVEEAPGVRSDIFDSLRGARAGGDVRILMIGNPTLVGGPFHDAFRGESSGWKTHTIDAFEIPNQQRLLPEGVDLQKTPDGELVEMLRSHPEEVLRDNPRPYLADPEWVIETWEDVSEDASNPIWQARVRGRFPEKSEHAIVKLAWIEPYEEEKPPEPEEDDRVWVDIGIDVAGPGDNETVLVAKQGRHVIRVESWPDSDPRGRVMGEIKKISRGVREIRRVNVDAIGEGRGLARHLDDKGLPVNEINVGKKPWGKNSQVEKENKERFRDLKAQLYWNLREAAQTGGVRGIDDQKLKAQVTSIRWMMDGHGRIKIESKDELRKRGVKSPDRAEALMLAYAEPPAREVPDVGIIQWS